MRNKLRNCFYPRKINVIAVYSPNRTPPLSFSPALPSAQETIVINQGSQTGRRLVVYVNCSALGSALARSLPLSPSFYCARQSKRWGNQPRGHNSSSLCLFGLPLPLIPWLTISLFEVKKKHTKRIF